MFEQQTLAEFGTRIASPEPAPGGGTVSALCGYLSCALVLKVCELTLGKEKYMSVHSEMRELRSQLLRLMQDFLSLMDEDCKAFLDVMAAVRMPRDGSTAEEKRTEAIKRATMRAAEVPLVTAQKCLGVLKYATVVLERGNRNAASDAAVACYLAISGIKGGLANVWVNIRGNEGVGFQGIREAAQAAEKESERLSGEVWRLVQERVKE